MDDSGKTVAAVVVTYNRKVLLLECLAAIDAQTRSVDRIYIVDQASTDGTREALETAGLLGSEKIRYIRNSVNTGSTGGFYLGIKTAADDGVDWVWVMDDDVIVDPDSCENMMTYTEFPEVVAVANQKLQRERRVDTYHIELADDASETKRPYTNLKFSSFAGLMFSSRAIKLAGLPKREFFYQEDDREYCERIIKVGSIALAENSFIVHKYANAPQIAKSFRGKTYSRMPVDLYCLRYFYWRNRLWRIVHGSGRKGVGESLSLYGKRLLNEVGMVSLVDRDHTPTRLFILWKAVLHGVLAKFDNTFAFKLQTRLRRSAPTGSLAE